MEQFASLAPVLRCPFTKEPLLYTDRREDFSRLLLDADPDARIRQGYLNHSGTNFYPIADGIIGMLPQSSFGAASKARLDDAVQQVKSFYEEFGWKKADTGDYNDSLRFVEKKTAAEEYYRHTTRRLSRFLQPRGRFILDVASGPVFQKENQALSEHFQQRICVDISIAALREARRNVGAERGIFINGDITNLPLADRICDNVMSIHTLYHVPRELQETAVEELLRVCKPGSNVVIVYNWAWHSWLMNLCLLPIRAVKAARRLRQYVTAKAANRWLSGGLYFYPHPPGWFERIAQKRENRRISFHPLTSINQDFIRFYVHDRWGGSRLLRFISRMEDRYSAYLGRNGAFSFVVFSQNQDDPGGSGQKVLSSSTEY